MVLVLIEPFGLRVEVERGSTLLESIRRAGISITSFCGGLGACGKCRVVVARRLESLSPPTEAEERLLGTDLRSGYRLACQARALGDVAIAIPAESRVDRAERKAVKEGLARAVELRPAVRKVRVSLPPPSLKDQRPDLDRLADALRNVLGLGRLRVSYSVLRELAPTARSSGWELTAVLVEDELASVEPGDTTGEVYGIAVDVGTSKIVAHLVDLNTGETVAADFVESPQLAYGEDIISRATFASASRDNAALLQRLLVNAINVLAEALCRRAGVSIDRVYEYVVVGNTVMHHFLLGLETKHLVTSPFTPVVGSRLSIEASELGLRGGRGARLTALPVIGGFVGADAVADALATGVLDRSDKVVLLDIGTNTEVFVGSAEKMAACSAPSGPALEGAHIKYGMRAVSGAIERVSIDEEGEVKYEVIGGGRPRGICGSAVVDAVAELYRRGFIDSRGRFRGASERKRLRRGPDGYEYVIAWADETSLGRDITISERDISEIILAKAAIYSGIAVLMKRVGVREEDVSEIMIAGSFGAHISPASAKAIGMIPDVPDDRVKFVGNTAIMGAKMSLLSVEARAEADRIAKLVDYVELSADPLFREEFAAALFIPHRDASRFPSLASPRP